MRGRQVFLETLLAHGVDRIFGNPGTTESPLLDALLDYPQLQYIVHLHEGVAVDRADEMGRVLQRAFKIANEAPAGPVFVALPINVMEQETSVPPGMPAHLFSASRPDPAGIEAMARLLIAAKNPTIVAGDEVARAHADKTLDKLAGRIGASVWFEGLRGRNSFPTGHPAWRGTLAFDAPGIAKQFADNDLVLMVGGPFFEEVWYAPGSPFPKGCKVLQIEPAPSRLAYNFSVDTAVVAAVNAALEALG